MIYFIHKYIENVLFVTGFCDDILMPNFVFTQLFTFPVNLLILIGLFFFVSEITFVSFRMF